jgi:hypothetical protein
MGAMFTKAFSGINWSDPASLLKYGILGLLLPVGTVLGLYRWLSPK